MLVNIVIESLHRMLTSNNFTLLLNPLRAKFIKWSNTLNKTFKDGYQQHNPLESMATYTCLRTATLSKERIRYKCFLVNFDKFLRAPFLRNTSGRLLLLIH